MKCDLHWITFQKVIEQQLTGIQESLLSPPDVWFFFSSFLLFLDWRMSIFTLHNCAATENLFGLQLRCSPINVNGQFWQVVPPVKLCMLRMPWLWHVYSPFRHVRVWMEGWEVCVKPWLSRLFLPPSGRLCESTLSLFYSVCFSSFLYWCNLIFSLVYFLSIVFLFIFFILLITFDSSSWVSPSVALLVYNGFWLEGGLPWLWVTLYIFFSDCIYKPMS